jgi:putative transposase
MLRLQAYRFELIPNGEQKRKMQQFAGSARYVFNRALALRNREREATGRKRSGYAALYRMLTPGGTIPQPPGWERPLYTRRTRRYSISKRPSRGISKA